MIHIGKNTKVPSYQKGISAGKSQKVIETSSSKFKSRNQKFLQCVHHLRVPSVVHILFHT